MFELNAWFGPGSPSCLISAWVCWEYKPSDCGCVIYFVSADFGMWTYPACKDDKAGPRCGQLDVSHKGLPPVEVNCFFFSNRSQETSTINGPKYCNAWNLKENKLSEQYTLGLGSERWPAELGLPNYGGPIILDCGFIQTVRDKFDQTHKK